MTEATLSVTPGRAPRAGAGTGAPGAAAIARLAAGLRDVLADADIARRLGRADTSVTFRDAHDGDAVALVLTAAAAEVRGGARGGTEVEIAMTPEAVDDLLGARLPLALILARRELAWSGPVRKLLRVDPILRRALDTHGA